MTRDLDWWRATGRVAQDHGTYLHAACPACGSSDNLVVGPGVHPDGHALIDCKTGCAYEDILAELDDGPPAATRARASAIRRTLVGREPFEIRDRKGTLVGVHERRDYSDGSKDFRWSWSSDKPQLADVPLYGSEEVADFDRTAPVILTEGERKRNRLKEAGYQTLALPYSKPVPNAPVLSVLDGFDVILWPDNDDVGRAAMDGVARAITGRARSVSVVSWPDAPPKGDAADYLDSHTVEECDALLRGAEPYRKPSALVTFSAAQLLASPPDKPVEIVPGLLPAGVSLLVAAPKLGKSWLAYQIAVAVAVGGDVLGRRARKGDFLYLALEDGEYRAYSRLAIILGHLGMTGWPSDAGTLDIAFNSERGDALIEQIEDWLAEHPNALGVGIDTLQKARPPRGNSRETQYALDVQDVGRVLALARRHPEIAVPIVHHDTKASHAPGADFVDAVSGTSGIGGSGDTILVLRRKRQDAAGTLDVTGKDVAESRLDLSFDGTFWSLDPLGGLTEQQRVALDLLAENGPMGPTVLGRLMGIAQPAASGHLNALVEAALVVREANGTYRVASPQITFRKRLDPSIDLIGSNDLIGANDDIGLIDLIDDDQQVEPPERGAIRPISPLYEGAADKVYKANKAVPPVGARGGRS